MKNFFTLLLASVFVFSGCTLPFTEPDTVETMNMSDAQTMSQENPEELFNTLLRANSKAGNDLIKEYLPEKDLLLKNTSKFLLKGNGSLEATPLGGGDLTFSLEANNKTDITNPEDPQRSSEMLGSFSMLGGLMKGEMKGLMTITDSSLFASLQDFDVNVPGENMNAIVEPFVGNWYGNTFSEINEMTGEEGFDISKLLSGSMTLSMVAVMDDIAENSDKYITYKSFEKEENGYYFFTATVSPEMYMKVMDDVIVPLIPLAGDELAEMKDMMAEEFEKIGDTPMQIAFTPANARYVIQQTQAYDMNTGDLLEGKNTVVSYTADGVDINVPLTDTDSFSFTKKGADFNVTMTIGEEKMTPMKGTYADNAVTFQIFDTFASDESSIMAEGSFVKKDDAWSGEITSPVFPAKLSIVSFSYAPENIEMKAEGYFSEQKLGEMEMSYVLSKTSSVDIEAPESFQSFDELMIQLDQGGTVESNNELFIDAQEGDIIDAEQKRQEAKDASESSTDTSVDPLTGLLSDDESISREESASNESKTYKRADVEALFQEMLDAQANVTLDESGQPSESDINIIMEIAAKQEAIMASGDFTEAEIQEIGMEYVKNNPPVAE